jgi:DNA-binding response OmpR family regulator
MEHVLVINDQPNHLVLLTSQLLWMNHQVITAYSHSTALEVAQIVSPRLITLDLNLGDEHGIELIGLLRQHPNTQQTPILVVSVWTHEQERILEMGANAFLRKPFDQGKLRAMVEMLLGDQVNNIAG